MPRLILKRSLSIGLQSSRKRQRLETYSQSQTVTKLVELIGTGKLSVIGAVDLANCMIEDGADHEAVCAFSSLGTNGQNPQNCERDLHRWLEGLGMRLQPYTVTMDLQVESHELRPREVSAQKSVNNTVARLVAWSLKCSAEGVAPDTGLYGEPLTGFRAEMKGKSLGPWKGAYFAFKADLKARKWMHSFERYYKAKLICDSCLVSSGCNCPPEMNFKNFGEDAAWPLTTVTHEDYMRMPGPKSDWLQVEGFRLENLAFDFMHNVFLGTARDLCGSSIRVLLRFGWYDHVEGDIDCKLAAIQREMVRDCRDLGFFMPKKPVLTEANLCKEDYAQLGTRFKASHVKLIVFWVARKVQKSSERAPNEDRVIHVLAACTYALQRCIDLCDASGLLLDTSAACEAADSLVLHLKTYSWLAAFFFAERALLFKVRPKHHYMFHQAMQLKAWRINLNGFATWDEEGFLGQIKAIAIACHGATATQRVYQRYLLVLALMVQRHRELNDL
ncbi:unnamed protein product [Durusdinium trenchii]|uniref:Uncharacterized protein n=1 Tax=Durusdinium trenchii TaxID=1381693 RepID=A0ABP0I8J1_9DINO